MMGRKYAVVYQNKTTGRVGVAEFAVERAAKDFFRDCHRHNLYRILTVTRIPEPEVNQLRSKTLELLDNPETAPYGEIIKTILEKLDLWEEIEQNEKCPGGRPKQSGTLTNYSALL